MNEFLHICAILIPCMLALSAMYFILLYGGLRLMARFGLADPDWFRRNGRG